ncbi:MAG: YraN family protein [Deltaproteobacteria bacterium]|nr:YraN family protein [Deltaproteobacteria bacterium]
MTRERLRCGAEGEALAAAFLRSRGYTILARNFRCAAGEIDVVALDARTIVFGEVRTRRGHAHGSALESVTTAKQRQVVRVAGIYLARHRLHAHPVRFDVVAVEVRGWTVTVAHVVDAFGAD